MNQVHILLVEDNEGDILLTKEAFKERKVINKMSVVKNGADAIDFVLKKGQYSGVSTPDLILLDINLPIRNGFEVLDTLKSHEESRRIPIIMLTTSSSQKDINKAYDHYANSYVTKPLEIDEFFSAAEKIEEFWIQLSRLSH